MSTFCEIDGSVVWYSFRLRFGVCDVAYVLSLLWMGIVGGGHWVGRGVLSPKRYWNVRKYIMRVKMIILLPVYIWRAQLWIKWPCGSKMEKGKRSPNLPDCYYKSKQPSSVWTLYVGCLQPRVMQSHRSTGVRANLTTYEKHSSVCFGFITGRDIPLESSLEESVQ